MKLISKKLIKDAQYGNLEALDKLLDIFSYFAYYYTLKQLNDEEAAKECTQLTLAKIVRYLPSYNEKDSFYGWGRKMLDSIISNYKRSNNRYNSRFTYDNDLVLSSNDSSLSAENKVMLSHLEKHIGEEYYEVLFLKIGYQYTFNEIAELCNCSLSTVRRRYEEAMKRTKKYLNGDPYEKKY